MASALEKIKQLDEQREKLLAAAKKVALKNANDAVKDLNDLGFSYQLVSKSATFGKGKPKG